MAKNENFYPADRLTVPVISGTVSGGPTSFGDLAGVALTDRDSSGNASVSFRGVYTVSVVAAGAQSVGAIIYITTATNVLTDASGAGKQRFGVLMDAIAGASTVSVRVRIGY